MTRKPNIANANAANASGQPLRFPGAQETAQRSSRRGTAAGLSDESPRDPATEVLAAFANVSRRIEDLARDLKCLGFFDDPDDRPRAA